MISRIIFFVASLIMASPAIAQFDLSAGSGVPYDYKNEVRTNLDHIYLLKTLAGAKLTYVSDNNAVQFYKYHQSTINKTPIPSSEIIISYSGGITTYEILNIESDRGYIAEYGARSNSVWIADYSKYTEEFNSLAIEEDALDECSYVTLNLHKITSALFFYDSEGAKEIKRKYTVEYRNAEWIAERKEYVEREFKESDYFASTFKINAPLIDTRFKLTGDQFAEHFASSKTIESADYAAVRVEIHLEREIISEGGTSAGDSASVENLHNAPVEMNFYSNANEPVTHFYKWKIFHNTDTSNPDDYLVSYTDRDFSYTFTEAGKYIVTLVVNQDLTCSKEEEFSFNVSESYLEFPNFLSPGISSEGKANIFRASYKSLTRFKCTIFNRWGNKVYEWSEPRDGWDGTYKGKTVSPGVYFYVVDAEGSDGIKYKRGGDINVLHGSGNITQ